MGNQAVRDKRKVNHVWNKNGLPLINKKKSRNDICEEHKIKIKKCGCPLDDYYGVSVGSTTKEMKTGTPVADIFDNSQAKYY